MSDVRERADVIRIFLVSSFVFLMLPESSLASQQPGKYPQEGRVIATAVHEVAVTTYAHIGGPNGGSVVPVHTVRRTRIYTVESETQTYELNCRKASQLFSAKIIECGGDNPWHIGDLVHFRVEGYWAFIPAPESTDPAQEQKLRVLSKH